MTVVVVAIDRVALELLHFELLGLPQLLHLAQLRLRVQQQARQENWTQAVFRRV